jgi:hypothetical protein
MVDMIMQSIFKDREGYISRKLSAAYLLTAINGCFLALGVLDSASYSSVIMTIWGVYFGVDAASNAMYTKYNHKSIDTPGDQDELGN